VSDDSTSPEGTPESASESANETPAPPLQEEGSSSQVVAGLRLLVGLAVLGLAVKGVISLVPQKVQEPVVTPQDPPQVQVLKLEEERFVQTEERYARLLPCQEWTLSLEVGGRVSQRPVMNGQECQPKQLLLALDPVPFQAQVKAAEARLANAAAGLRLAKTELERVRALAQSTATQRDLDAALAQRDQSQALLAEAEASLSEARFRLAHSSLNAPAKGVVSQLAVEVGTVVAPGQALGRFARRDVLLAKLLVSADVRRGLEVGQRASVVDDMERVYPATLARAAPVPAGATGQFEVEFEVENPKGVLLPGEPIRVRFSHGQAASRLRVPRGTVYEEYGLWRALVPPADRQGETFSAASAPVVLGPGDPLAGWVTIHSGLQAGSEVLIPDRVVLVREGQVVRSGSVETGWLPPYSRGE
jgi:RND family efflux transporter MFP subunit